MKAKVLFFILIVSFLKLSGCKQESPEAKIRQTIQDFYKSYEDLDKDAFLAVISGNKSVKKGSAAMFDYYVAMAEFKEMVIDEFGQDGWKILEEPPDAQLALNSLLDEVDMDNLQIEIQGNKAICKTNFKQPFTLIKIDGKWYIDIESTLGPATEGEIDMTVNMFSSIIDILNQAKQQVGRPGVTAESLDYEIGQAIMQVTIDGANASMQ